MLAPLERAGIADRPTFAMGLHGDLIGPLQGNAGRFLDLQDHRFEAVVVIIVEDDIPGKIRLGLFFRFGQGVGSFEGLWAHRRSGEKKGPDRFPFGERFRAGEVLTEIDGRLSIDPLFAPDRLRKMSAVVCISTSNHSL